MKLDITPDVAVGRPVQSNTQLRIKQTRFARR